MLREALKSNLKNWKLLKKGILFSKTYQNILILEQCRMSEVVFGDDKAKNW
jgi:hypothetical protein